MTQIDHLSGNDFEAFLQNLFENMGYKVTKTQKSHDYGADLILKKNDNISIVQAKCYSEKVGPSAIQEIISAKSHYSADYLIAVTNNYFTKEAQVLANENGVSMIDRNGLSNFVQKFGAIIEKTECTFSALSNESKAEINQRFKTMI